MAYPNASTRDLFSALRTLHDMTRNAPKDYAPESTSWVISKIRYELRNRGFFAEHEDELHGDHSFILDPTDPLWIDVYQLDVSPRHDRGRIEDLFRAHYVKRCIDPYDCSGEAFTMDFHVFKRRGAWWVYEWVSLNV